DSSRLLADLGAGIDALLEAELDAVVASTSKEITSPGQEFHGEPTKKADPALLADAARAAQKKKPAKPPKTSPGMPTPPAVGAELARELAGPIADIRAVADEALRILTDERLRRRYASHLR